MFIEKRKTLKPKKSLSLTLNSHNYTLDSFNIHGGMHVLLHDNIEQQSITNKSTKLLSVAFTNKDAWIEFEKNVQQLFVTKKNTREIILDIKKNFPSDIWLNPNYTFDKNISKQNKNINSHEQKGKVNFDTISVMGLIQEDAQGQSILSKMGIIQPFSDFKPAGGETKCKIRFNNKEIHFSFNHKTNLFSNWSKGSGSLGGSGAKQFLSKAFNFDANKVNQLLFQIMKENNMDDLIIEKDYFTFKTSAPLPISRSKPEDINKIVKYLEERRKIAPETTRELIKAGAIQYAFMIRAAKAVRDKTLIKNRRNGDMMDFNKPKDAINTDMFYFPLMNKDDMPISIQYLSLDPKFNSKMNMGSTFGIYSGIRNKGANNYILSEAAFDNFALYEMAKTKIDTSKYNFFSCQSVGGIDTWIESNFGFVFNENKNGELIIQKVEKEIIANDFSDKYLEGFKKEMIGDQSYTRKFSFIYNAKDKDLIKKMKAIDHSLKSIDSNIKTEWIESNNRFVKYTDYTPLDIVLDATSLDSWLDRNNFTVDNGYLQSKQIKIKATDVTDKDIASFKKHKVNSLIAACDNDHAGEKAAKKIKLFCKIFGVKYANWAPKHPLIKDHNDCLKLFKGVSVDIDDDKSKEKVIVDHKQFNRETLFDYIDESQIQYIEPIKSKKKLEHKAF
jgi:hypothetical protein